MGCLLIAFVVIPLVEITFLMMLADRFSWQATLGLVIATGVTGAALARWQGYRAVERIHTQLAAGEIPTTALFDAAAIFIAGILLITPGVFTDLCGILLLIPYVRHWIRKRIVVSYMRREGNSNPFASHPGELREDRVIDVEVIDAEGRKRDRD